MSSNVSSSGKSLVWDGVGVAFAFGFGALTGKMFKQNVIHSGAVFASITAAKIFSDRIITSLENKYNWQPSTRRITRGVSDIISSSAIMTAAIGLRFLTPVFGILFVTSFVANKIADTILTEVKERKGWDEATYRIATSISGFVISTAVIVSAAAFGILGTGSAAISIGALTLLSIVAIVINYRKIGNDMSISLRSNFAPVSKHT